MSFNANIPVFICDPVDTGNNDAGARSNAFLYRRFGEGFGHAAGIKFIHQRTDDGTAIETLIRLVVA